MRQAEKFYDKHAAGYEAKFDNVFARGIKRKEEEDVLEFLFEHLHPGGRLLELGCGTGIFTIPVAQKGYDVTAVDMSQGMLDELQKKLDANDVKTVTLVKSDVEGLADLGKFDGVYGIGLLEYLKSPEGCVRRAGELLKPGGITCFTGPSVSYNGVMYYIISLFRKRMRMQLFTRRRFRKAVEGAGLDFVALRKVGWHLPLMRSLTSIFAGRKPVSEG